MNLQDWINKGKPLNSFINCDNIEFMKEISDGFFELAIVDPPYFLGPNKANYYRGGNQKKYNNYRDIYSWENPSQKYFNELKRISKNQIIWGINYYNINYLGSGRIIWDKKMIFQGMIFQIAKLHIVVFKNI